MATTAPDGSWNGTEEDIGTQGIYAPNGAIRVTGLTEPEPEE